MKYFKTNSICLIVGLLLGGCAASGPKHYGAKHVTTPPVIDGRLGDASWQGAVWTDDFIDIEGPDKKRPAFRTRAKMCWDDTYLYVAADMEEPHLWGTLTERDAIIYRDNDFEIFIDPDGDRADYNEYEINVLGTEMDLRMDRPYRDGGNYDLRWDFAGVQSAVSVGGTVNDPRDRDIGWTVEVAIPWASMADTANMACPPNLGDVWRINFSRVQWPLRSVNGAYVKPDKATEDNWVWSPQDAIDMHRPEYWGFVRFE